MKKDGWTDRRGTNTAESHTYEEKSHTYEEKRQEFETVKERLKTRGGDRRNQRAGAESVRTWS